MGTVLATGHLHRFSDWAIVFVGSVFQSTMFVTILICLTHLAHLAENEVQKHRLVVSGYLLALFSVGAFLDVPPKVVQYVLVPSWFVSWCLSHHVVLDGLAPPFIVFGCACCLFASYYHSVCHAQSRSLWEAMNELDIERKLLLSTQEASEQLIVQLKAEQSAAADLLSMLCDATAWLASDGDTVVRSETRFDAIVGHSALNECLSSFIPEEEQNRFEVASTKSPASAPKLRVLTTTILNSITGVRADVDVFMVSRTDESSEADPLVRVPRYLVGVRLSQLEPAAALQCHQPPAWPLDSQSHSEHVAVIDGLQKNNILPHAAELEAAKTLEDDTLSISSGSSLRPISQVGSKFRKRKLNGLEEQNKCSARFVFFSRA